MKKVYVYIILLFVSYLSYQCKQDPDAHLARYLEENESQIALLRNWEIHFEPERDFWYCKHYHDRDSLLLHVIVYVDKRNQITSYNVRSLKEDSITALQLATQNINTLYIIKRIYGYKCIRACEVELFNDTLSYDFTINMGDKKTTCFIRLMKMDSDTTYKLLYKKWYVRKQPHDVDSIWAMKNIHRIKRYKLN